MATSGFSKSRNLLARKRLLRRDTARKAILETLEARQLLAVGPQLLGVQPNTGDLLTNGEVLNESPRELVFRFDDRAGVDPTTLDGIRIVRSGEDGVFERASAATDFGTGGQTLVEFFAQEPGESGNGIEIEFSSRTHNQGRAPIITVEDRVIRVELNSNPVQETRVEDLLQAFDPENQSPATNLVYALRLRGSQVIGIGNTGAPRTLTLSGANAAKASTNFGISNDLEVRFIAKDAGNDGIGLQINVTARDRGGAGNPIISVVGKTINIEINSNPRFPTTAQEFVDALNANDALSSSLLEAKLVSGVGATRIGTAPITYSPIELGGVSDIEIIPAFVGLGDTDREIVMRFAEPLPDDRYRIEILGQGSRTLRNVDGEAFNCGDSQAINFELDLGARIEAIVPQPVTRNAAGQLVQERNKIEVFFNDDDLMDVSQIATVNGIALSDIRELRTPLFFDSSDTLTFVSTVGETSVLDSSFYQLFHTADSLDSSDDVRILPNAVRYYPDTDRVILTFSRNLDELTNPSTGGLLPQGELRLRVGSNEGTSLAPASLDATGVADAADTFAGATDLSASWTPGAGGTQSLIIDGEIDNQSPFLLDFPGGSDEPGNRANRYQDNLRLDADSVDGTSVLYYNFQRNLGVFSNSNLVNAITEQQKQRVREIFSIYEEHLGARFVETDSLGMTVAVGDMRAIQPFEDVVGSGLPGVNELNGPGGTYYEAGTLRVNGQLGTVLDIQDFSAAGLGEFGGPFQRAAMQAVGRLIGLGLNDEAGDLTIQSFDAVFAPGVGSEIILPGDPDIVHGQFLYRPDSKDIDLYQFSLPVAGRISIEAFAERMSSSSLLDSQIRLFQEGASGWEQIATNDDYFSSDSYVELDLSQGNYIVGVSASGNDRYDPVIGDTGVGGLSEGSYQLRMDFQPPAQGLLRDGTGTAFDGDSNGTPEGVFNFWFRPSGPSNTKFVDKAANAGGDGSINTPYNNIAAALAVAQAGDVVRIVGNGGADGQIATRGDNVSYEIGFDILGRPLSDGATLDVPADVSVMIDSGAILKLRRARVGVGSTSVSVDRSGGSLLVLGTPNLIDASGNAILGGSGDPVSGDVIFTSVNDATIGTVSSNSSIGGSTPTSGDWGGIDFRAQIDKSLPGRNDQEAAGQFLNWVAHADVRYGGGQVVVDGVSQTVNSIQMVDARPTVLNSTIVNGSGAALSATPDSFLESNFHSPTEQGAGNFTVDYHRNGPDLAGNRFLSNAINGLQVRVNPGTNDVTMTVPGRFDDAEVVHYIPENLTIQGTAGGATLANEGPSSTSVLLSERVGGTLPFGTYNYRFTSIDANGIESTASEPTNSIFNFQTGSVVISNLPLGVNRIYRSGADGNGPYELIADFNSNTNQFVDSGTTLGTILPDNLDRFAARQDARLSIDPGVILKFNGSRIDVDFGAQLIAEGTDGNPVVFTSLADTSYGAGGTFSTANNSTQGANPGEWGGIYVGHTSSASFDHAVVSYGGGSTRIEGGFADFSAIEVHQGELRLTNSRISENANGSTTSTSADRAGRGANDTSTIFVRGAQPIIVDNIILRNEGPAISANVGSLNSEEVVDYGRSTGQSDSFESLITNRGPLVDANRLSDNEVNGLVVRGGQLNTEGWWDDTDIVHVVFDEIVVPDHQHFSGLRLASAADQSLVVKLSGETAGFTATGTPLDNANRIGGSVQLVGQPSFPVILTSLDDNTVGAGFTVEGEVQNETTVAEGGGLPTIGEIANGTLIDNDVDVNIPGHFAFNVGNAGSSGILLPGAGGITAQGNTQLFVNIDVIFEFLNFVDVGGNGNAIDLSQTTITQAPTLIAPDVVESRGNFPGPNGVVNWRVESSIESGTTTVVNRMFFDSANALGDLQVINYLDEDVQGVSDDLLYQTGTPGEADFRAFTLDGPERIGFSQGGIYAPTPSQLENAVYEGWAADEYRDLLGDIEGPGTTYTIPGNIDLNDLPPVVDPQLGDINGLADVTTAFAWRVDPTATEAIVTSFLELVPRNPANAASPGDWRSVLFDTYSNDRNVAIASELENPLSSAPQANETPDSAQFVGSLAPNEGSGDENNRLGVQIDGLISQPTDIDVYSFRANAGTEVWLDIDRTDNSLDTVIELIDANGRTLALSDSSLAEEADPSLLFASADMALQSVNPLRKSATDFYFESAQGTPKDLNSTNPKDAGLRVRLPGDVGSNNLYHVRVRSSSLQAGDPTSNLVNDPTGGLTTGRYQLQIRLNEVDEVPGSSITYADIRFAANGLQLVGVPGNSPLVGESGEIENIGGPRNDTLGSAQDLGNVLQTNLQAISVAGSLDNLSDVDWFSFDLNYENITPTALREYFSTVLDIDYADGIGRADTSIYVFNEAGQLILSGLNSNSVDDQTNLPGNLSGGSFGGLDPYVGPFELPSGRYFAAITNSLQVPAVLAAYTDPNFADPEMRLQPIESIELIAEDHVSTQGGSTALPPRTPILFPTAGDFDGTTFYTDQNDSIVNFSLSDIPLYVSQDVGQERTNLYVVNPFTGETRLQVGRGNFDVQDIDLRPNGELRAFDRVIESNIGNNDADGFADYINIDPGTGQFADAGDLGLQTNFLNTTANPPAPVAANDGFNVEAITFANLNGQERGLLVGNRPTPPGENPSYGFGTTNINTNNGFPGVFRPGVTNFTNVIYEFDEATGAATSSPAQDKTGIGTATGAGTAIRERGRIETFTLDPLGNIVTSSSRLLAREVTTGSNSAGPNFVIRDGDQLTIEDGSLPPNATNIEFDLGPQVVWNYNPSQGQFITDGMQFELDGLVYEFDTGNIVVVDAFNGSQVTDGSTVRIENGTGTVLIFEFDSDSNVIGAGNIGVPFTATMSQADLVQALVTTINAQVGFGVTAEANPNSNRISLVGASETQPVQVTGFGLSVDGTLGVSAGANRIPISEAASLNELLLAMSQNVGGGVTIGFDSGRMNFSGATNGIFTDLAVAGLVADLGTDGNVSPGAIPVQVLASDTAETVAARIAQAINASGIPALSATASGDEVQLAGAVITNAGPLVQLGVAPGGIVTGAAVIGNTMYTVSDAGGLYAVDFPLTITSGNVGRYVDTSYDLVGIQFSGLVEGPTHLQNGELSQLLFGIDTQGNIHAFDTAGRPQPVFANGATSVSTGLFGANGLTLSSLDFNLWHVDANGRGGDAGHGLPNTPNDSRANFTGGQSLYFGFNSAGANGVGDLTGPNSTGLADSYNFPGGAAGAIESAAFSLAGIAPEDLPTLYFTYFFETEQADSDLGLGNNADDYMRDSLRVYASGPDGQWTLLATNNDPVQGGSNSGSFDDEFDPFLTGNTNVQPLFDNVGAWRQARIPLDLFAGQEDVKLRIEFSSHGGFGYGFEGGRGPEIRTVAGDVLVDGETLVVNGQAFEIETGPTLNIPGGASITNGDFVTIEGTRYVFSDGSIVVSAPDVEVTFASTMSADEVATSLQNAIATAVITPPVITGLTFTNETNDTIATAEVTGISGESVRIVGEGNIGDNAALANAGEDVDMLRLDLDRGATVTVQVDAASQGSALDSFVRVFDSLGNVLRDANGFVVQNDDANGSTDSFLTFTVEDAGTYYIGVSGSGNQTYNPSVLGTANEAGTIGDYQLSITVEKLLNPVVSGNRLQLQGADDVTLPIGSPLAIQGATGSNGVPVYVTLDMNAEQVALALQESLADFFANGARSAYPINGSTVDLTGLVGYNGFDFTTGLPAPSITDLDPGPFGATTNFVGDAFSAFNEGTNFDGTTNNGNPGFLGGQNNDFEGVYLDDFIIGVAGRGEMVMRSSVNTNFITDPQLEITNPDQFNPEILVGEYQLEIRGGQEYGIPTLAGFPDTLIVNDTFPYDARSVEGVSIRFNAAASMVAGQTFQIGDGTRTLTFELDDVNDNTAVQPGNFALPFNTAVVDPVSGASRSETAETIAARFRDIVNSDQIQNLLSISANLLNNDEIGATSSTVVLIGPGTADVPTSVGEVVVSQGGGGGANRARPQGQIVIDSARISNSNGFGVTVAAAQVDPDTGISVPGTPRNLITLNQENLVPGAVIMNSEFVSNTAGGINISGSDAGGANVPQSATSFIRLVNNTIVGGTVSAIEDVNPTFVGGQIFPTGFLSFADASVSYNNLAGGGPAPAAGLDDPTQALGVPNYTGTGEPIAGQNVVSLGPGGQLVVEFNNNFLTGSGNADPDLMIVEVGDSEEVIVEVSVDGVNFVNVGRASGASPTIDIDAFGFNINSRIPFVRVTDVFGQGATTGESVGADIDAIGAISSVAAELSVPGGEGIVIANNATATLLNNVVVNTLTGINIDASSSSTVIGGTVYQRNVQDVAGSATLGQFPLVLDRNIPVFVSAAERNLYPAAGSPIIDASIDSLGDRPSLVAVKEPLGIPGSPILAPQFDINGQLRINDPNVDAPAGLGGNIFKDRGAQDRADFVGPSVILQNPIDNDSAGQDTNPDPTIVELTNATLRHFDIRIADGLAPSDPVAGTGVNHSTVRSESVLVFRNNTPLIEGIDYRFGYDSTNGVIRLTPLAGVWQAESVYTIRFVNSSESSIVAQTASEYTDGDQVTVIDATGSQTIFEVDLGFLIDIPTNNGTDAILSDGTTFLLDDGIRRIQFELDNNGSVTPGTVGVNIGTSPTTETAAAAIQSAIVGSGIDARVALQNSTVQILSDSPLQLLAQNSNLIISGSSGVQTVFGLQIPLEQGIPAGISDGQTFTIDRNGSPVTFELDTNGTVLAGNTPVQIAPSASAAQIGAALVTAIDAAGLGLSPAYIGNGLVRLGGDANTQLDLTSTVLTQSGVAGVPASTKVEVPLGSSSTEVAAILKTAIEAQGFPGTTVTQFGNRLVLSNVLGVAGTGANLVDAIRDLAGNPLKPNQTDGTTTLTVFMGEGFDYGDAGGNHTSLAAQGGPRHTVVSGLSLGPTATVDADAKLVDADLDDGVAFSDVFAAFQTNASIEITNTTGNDSFVSMWIDYNGDGFFADVERVVSSQLTNASTTVSFVVPASAIAGEAYARVRISTDADAILSPNGDAVDGEVEDYLITINGNPYTNGLNNLDVNRDGFVSPIDALQVVNYLNDPRNPTTLSLPAPGTPPFIDVNGDGTVSPIDALLVINHLNEVAGGSGEGESGFAAFGSGQSSVLASDWAPGLESMVDQVKRHDPLSVTEGQFDEALLDSESDFGLGFDNASQQGSNTADLAWADLADDKSASVDAGDLLDDDDLLADLS